MISLQTPVPFFTWSMVDLNEMNPTKDPTERPLTPTETEELHDSLEQGLLKLAVDANGESEEIIEALSDHLDQVYEKYWDARDDGEGADVKVDGWDRHDWALAYGAVFGEQLVRAAEWEWVWLEKEGDGVLAVVSPEREFVVFAPHIFRLFFDDVQNANNISLLFNMILDGGFPVSSRRYQPLM
jgi:hypothetical protein